MTATRDIKSYLTALLLLLLIPFTGRATGLSGDVIYIEGEEWELMAKPIDEDSVIFARLMDFIPENHCATTANWQGYTGFWEVRNNRLYLQKIEVCLYDREKQKKSTLTFDADTLKPVFASYSTPDGIFARWFTGEIRAGKGDLVRYIHSGFHRNLQIEKVMTVKDGKIIGTHLYHNQKKAGLNLKDAQAELIKRFPWKQFPEIKGQRLIFSIRDFKMTDDGHLLDFNVVTLFIRPMKKEIKTPDSLLIKAFKETMKSIYPWETFYVNGKLLMEFNQFVMPIWEN